MDEGVLIPGWISEKMSFCQLTFSENYNQIKQQGKRYSITVVLEQLLGAEIHIDLQKFQMGTQLVLKLHLLVL